ncbi:MAG: type II secretion system protein GspE [Nitrospirae bacterium RIFCSPHIGHO2_02_FULL_42_12]|nr:MAG: type II secretion system protein GspE [Nitrospirae bacterium RIFCSPHIGHO2_02_FULL_42_12]
MARKKELLGEILHRLSPINEKEIEECLRIQQEKGGRIGEILIHLKHIKEIDLLKALSIQFRIPYIQNLTEDEIDKGLVSSIPISFLKRHIILPYKRENNIVRLAISDPLNISPIDDLKIFLNSEVEIYLTESITILNAINLAYETHKEAAEQVIEDMGDQNLTVGFEEPIDLIDVVDEAPIIKLINSLLFRSVKERASDLHFEPFERDIIVRFRIDGVLHNILTLPKKFHPSITSRIKIMASLNIAEKRLPQDGRISLKIAGKDIDVRVSLIPTSFGERVVLRLLDKSGYLLRLTDIGLSKEMQGVFNRLIRLTHGIILVTGPTGSGKTTTLYAALTEINSPDKNIITIEDPVEYQVKGIGQMQINPKIELTFARGLRSILRQDPDVIMVGEIRDLETAEIAIQASLTGHLVFSTLHTNDSAGAITRLIDMGIEPFLVSSSVVAIMAQRLVRTLCTSCKKEYTPAGSEIEELGIEQSRLYGHTIYLAVGCDKCMQTGYRGRTGIYELLLINDDVRSLILQNVNSQLIKNKTIEIGMTTLRADGAKKVLEGITSIEEVARVTQEDVIE